ncbi:MAG: MBL fold metallo-hydrolase [Candidatus Saccharimonadales bacterium]
MEIEFYGANCFRINTKKTAIVIDDNLSELGAKSVTRPGDVVLYTSPHKELEAEPRILIDQPGEYEVSNISVQGIPARSHMDEDGKQTATIYKVTADDVRLAVVGHIYPELTDDELEQIGTVDILLIPVGGNGYTLDPVGALKIIKKIEPKIVVPSHYEDKKLKYEVPQQDLESAIKGLAMEPKETVPKLKLKPTEFASEGTQLVVLERQ